MTNLILFAIAVLLAVVLGLKTKVNMGIWAFLFAFVLGFFRAELSVAGVVGKFPSGNFYMFIAAGMFYAFGNMNGAINLLAQKLVYKFRRQTWMGPIALFLVAAVVSASGCNGTTGLILSGMIYAFASAMDINPLPCLVAVHAAAGGLGFLPWTSAGSNSYSIYSAVVDPSKAMSSHYVAVLVATLILLGGMVVTGLITKAFGKRNGKVLEMEKPAEFNKQQRTTLYIILISLILIIAPIVLNTVFKTPFTKKLSGIICIQTVWTLFIVVQALLNLGDLKDIISTKVPWNSIILVTGMGTLFNLAAPLGVAEIFAEFVGGVPTMLVLPALATICAILSFFVSGLVINPLFAPLVAGFAAATGINVTLIIAAIIAGGGATSISPVSAGGAYLLSAAPNEEVRTKCMGGLAKVAICNVVAEFAIWLVISLLFA